MKQTLLAFIMLTTLISCDEKGGDEQEQKEYFKQLGSALTIGSPSSTRVLISEDNTAIFPALVIDKEEYDKKEVIYEEDIDITPLSLVFNFQPTPFISSITSEYSLLTYGNALSNAYASEQWLTHSEENHTESAIMSYGAFSSTEEAMEFLDNKEAESLFDSGEYATNFAAKFIATKYSIDVRLDSDFISGDTPDNYYIERVEYGRYIYLVIQTNEEYKTVMEMFEKGILEGDSSYLDEYLALLTDISIKQRGVPMGGSLIGEDGFKRLNEAFNSDTATYENVPIAFEVKAI